MIPRWKRRLLIARAQILSDGYEICQLLESPHPEVRKATRDLLAGVCWREGQFLIHYFELLMRENRGV